MNRPRCTVSVMRGLIELVGMAWHELNATRTRRELLSEHGRTAVRDMERASEWVDAMQKWYSYQALDSLLRRKD